MFELSSVCVYAVVVYIHRFMVFDCLHKLWIIWQKNKCAPVSCDPSSFEQFILTFSFRKLRAHAPHHLYVWFYTRFTSTHIQIEVDSEYERNARKIRRRREKQKSKLRARCSVRVSPCTRDFHLKMKHVKDVNKLDISIWTHIDALIAHFPALMFSADTLT